ncbi:MAG: MATE family efflux transporter, partial [Bacteroidota bacterium]
MQAISQWIRQHQFHIRDTLKLSFPVMIGQLGNILMSFIDNLMIGDLGYVPLSAASLANCMSFILIVLGIGISSALSPLVAEASTGARERVGSFLRNGTWVGIGAGIVLGGLTYWSADWLLWLDQPIEDVVLAAPYQRILSFSVLPLMVFLMFKQFTDGMSFTRPAMY